MNQPGRLLCIFCCACNATITGSHASTFCSVYINCSGYFTYFLLFIQNYHLICHCIPTHPPISNIGRYIRNLYNRHTIYSDQLCTTKEEYAKWLLAQKPWIVSISGTTKLHRMEENIGAATLTLSSGDLTAIQKTVWQMEVQGAHYPEQLQKLVGK